MKCFSAGEVVNISPDVTCIFTLLSVAFCHAEFLNIAKVIKIFTKLEKFSLNHML